MERFSYFTKRHLGYLIVIIVLILCLAFYFKIVFPLKSDMTMAKNKLQVEHQLITTYQKKKQKGANEINQQSLEKSVPPQAAIDDLLIFLDKAESSSKSHIDSVSFGSDMGVNSPTSSTQNSNLPKGLKKINAQLTVTAPDFQKLLAFLDQLEKSPRRIVINNVSLSTKNGATHSISLSTKISTFYFNDKK